MSEPSGRPKGAKGLSPPPKSPIWWRSFSVGLKPTLHCILLPSAFCLLPSSRRSIDYFLSPAVTDAFNDVAAVVRKGGTVMAEEGVLTPNHPIWVKYAHAMSPIGQHLAQLLVKLINPSTNSHLKVLDLAASHGWFGITFAQHNPNIEVVAVDWANVVEVAKENAETQGLNGRYRTIPGSALDVDYGNGYDLVLLTDFLQGFDAPTCETLLKKVHAALADGGRAVTLELIPQENRVSPPLAAALGMMLLASTPNGDTYTFPELERIFHNAGFSRCELHSLPPLAQSVIISYK
jgi:2-polyprenyl-3-methyl-5-hydroxy-6-metoxy-1,4-benzoquinol methylase